MAIATRQPVVLEPASQEFVDATSDAAVHLRAHPRPRRARCSTTSRPSRSRSCRSTSAGSPSPPRWATCASASCGRPAPQGRCRRSSTCTAAAGCSATRTRTTGSSASSPSAPAPPSCSSSTTAHPRRTTPSRSSRATPPRSGSCARAPRNGLDPERIAVAGDSVGGGMTAALALMAKRARRRPLRAAVDVLPGHRRRHGHRLVRAVRGGLLPRRQGDGVVLGRLPARPRATLGAVRVAAPRERRAARRPTAGVRDRRRGRRAPRRGRGLRGAPPGRPGSRSRPSATTASRTTS